MTETCSAPMVKLSLNKDAQFLFAEKDAYWSADLINVEYEPEIHWLFRRAADRPFAMLDAGANYGYWSVLASSKSYGSHPTVAIEPCKANFEWLRRNASANGERFQTLCRACLDTNGEQVTLYGKKHYGLSLRTDWHSGDIDQAEQVETIRLDDAADRYMPNRKYPALVKLDVEGSEIPALRGAQRLIAEGSLIVYEDHGKEASHQISQFVLALDGIAVWYVESDGPRRITTIEQAAAIKTDPVAGYNFFACRTSSPWSGPFTDALSANRGKFGKVQ